MSEVDLQPRTKTKNGKNISTRAATRPKPVPGGPKPAENLGLAGATDEERGRNDETVVRSSLRPSRTSAAPTCSPLSAPSPSPPQPPPPRQSRAPRHPTPGLRRNPAGTGRGSGCRRRTRKSARKVGGRRRSPRPGSPVTSRNTTTSLRLTCSRWTAKLWTQTTSCWTIRPLLAFLQTQRFQPRQLKQLRRRPGATRRRN